MWIIRFLRTLSLYSLILASVGLFALSYFNPKLFDKVRLFAMDTIAPVLVVTDGIITYASSVQAKAYDLLYVYKQNQYYKQRQADYDQKSVQLAVLQQEVKNLQYMLNYTDQFGVPNGFMAKIVSFSGGAYDRSYILDKGKIDGVRVGHVIVFDGYMAGYIIDVSNTISRAIALTNINASVPVMNENGQHRGLVIGDGAKLPKFIYADTITDFSEQDALYTSGDGGVFPSGLPVGVIDTIYNHNNVRIRPYAYKQDIKFVYILQYPSKLLSEMLLQGD